ncbi:hypothetical protein HMPREF1991_01034 [Hoylesella loescheii DSM 19665 = JCM 12249 = ATCC 15930]|uniref:Uncharacterized protein n=1 Tax=Hoylesella loescheii DSM 19665 = JCM 12249 = ATCC 15930 TaxID=1122985 RepID=A0A069QJ87_HOYLO|nr:hypothetical protein HMPREF6745_1349 [Prevotella sp. oral taxon 472 str. F0295]KDR52890.1 hypothetical protein HMPREF1991_01034 [Hoylesella loescheii DSM 19665 = JCM 12249 = ATCC 15930]
MSRHEQQDEHQRQLYLFHLVISFYKGCQPFVARIRGLWDGEALLGVPFAGFVILNLHPI